MWNKLLFLLLFFLLPSSLSATPWHVDVWGFSYHLDRAKQLNETNHGVGVRYQFMEHKYLRYSAAAGVFKDSMYDYSKYAGMVVETNTPIVSLQLNGVVMSRPSYNRGSLFVAPLPSLGIDLTVVKFNIFYIPKAEAYGLIETVAVSLSIPINQGGNNEQR